MFINIVVVHSYIIITTELVIFRYYTLGKYTNWPGVRIKKNNVLVWFTNVLKFNVFKRDNFCRVYIGRVFSVAQHTSLEKTINNKHFKYTARIFQPFS